MTNEQELTVKERLERLEDLGRTNLVATILSITQAHVIGMGGDEAPQEAIDELNDIRVEYIDRAESFTRKWGEWLNEHEKEVLDRHGKTVL